ncbi:MAG: hypothetical protein WCA49_01140 [Candidatus Sulfotelmatobacter sp.]
MSRHGYFFWIVLLGVAASIAVACSNIPERQALTVTLSPSAATAPADGQVQFTATGTYNLPPTTVTPLQANWAVVDQAGAQTTAVTISANGLAQCTAAASGVFTVGAWVVEFSRPPGAVCLVVSPFGNPCGDSVIGFALLTCS